MRKLLDRALSEKQILILGEIERNKCTLTGLAEIIYKKHKISHSVSRWNLKGLRALNLIDCGDSKPVVLTENGAIVNKILGGE